MNQFTFFHSKGKPAKVEMIVSDLMLDLFKHHLEIEIELLQGIHVRQAEGMNHCTIHVDGFKKELFEDFIRMLVKHPSMKVNIAGMDLNPN